MKERDKHRIEGLLKARSQDLGQRRARGARAMVDAPSAQPASDRSDGRALPDARTCGDCGEEIAPRRLRAMPSAARCLPCQRTFERRHARA